METQRVLDSELTVDLEPTEMDIEEIYRTMSSEVFHSVKKSEGAGSIHSAFTGCSAVDWMVENLFLKSREDSIPIGRQLIMKSLLLEVSKESITPISVEHASFRDAETSLYMFKKKETPINSYYERRKRGRVGGGLSVTNYSEVFEALRDPGNGLPLGTHKSRSFSFLNSEKFENCFRGFEVINWMLINLPFRTRLEAISFCTTLLQQGYIIPAKVKKREKATVTSIFKDSDTLYRLSEKNDFPMIDSKAKYGIEDFEIIGPLGRGAVGTVFKVLKKDSNTYYAMKIVEKSQFKSPDRLGDPPKFKLRNLITERNVLLNDHPFLATLHFSFQTKSKIYFVMDYIQGGNLKQIKKTHPRGIFKEKEIRFVGAELVEALDFLHGCGIVYRDLKPENILIDSEGHVALTDFGICKELNQERTNSFCGTPSYLAPEVISRKSYGYEVDWWSLGVLLYEMATGLNPFYNENMKECFNNVLYRKVIFPEMLLKKDLMSLLKGLLTRDPKVRLSGEDIKCHSFFRDINWEKLCLRQEKSPMKPLPEQPNDGESSEITIELSTDSTGQFSHVDEFTFTDITHETPLLQ